MIIIKYFLLVFFCKIDLAVLEKLKNRYKSCQRCAILSTCCKITTIMDCKTSDWDKKRRKFGNRNQKYCSYGAATELKS